MPELNLILDCIVLVILLPLLLREIIFAYFGREEIVLQLDEMTDFSVAERTPERLVVAATLPVANEGKQCGTIMDAILRPQLPYEQYDGALVRGKVELEPRGGRTLEDAIAHLVDFRADLIYQETGRTPVHYEQAIIMMGAEEIAALAGVELRREGGAQHG